MIKKTYINTTIATARFPLATGPKFARSGNILKGNDPMAMDLI